MDSSTVADPRQKMGAINEMYHKIFGQLGHVLANSGSGYPDNIFVVSLSMLAEENDLAEAFSYTWDSSRRP